jgi:t-SNARE complex subunit (syntaxin)
MSTERRWIDADRGRTATGDKPVAMPLRPPQIHTSVTYLIIIIIIIIIIIYHLYARYLQLYT